MKKIIINKLIFSILASLMILSLSCIEDQKLIKYTVNFDSNGAIGTPPSSITVIEADYDYTNSVYWDLITLPHKGNLTYQGKNFYGWNTLPDGTGKRYSPGSVFKVESNVTFYAEWMQSLTSLATAPQNLTLTYSGGFQLAWDKVEGYENLEDPNEMYMYDGRIFMTYVVFRRATSAGVYSSNNRFIPIAISSKPTYRDTRFDVLLGGTFEYFVTLAIATAKDYGSDFDLVLGQHSNMVALKFIGSGTPLPAPTGLKVEIYSHNGVRVSWDPHPLTTKFRLYYSYDNVTYYNEYGPIVSIINKTETYFGPTRGRTVYFRVTAVNSMQENGYFSEPVSTRIPNVPSKVTGLTASALSATSIELKWDSNIDATSYNIYSLLGASLYSGTLLDVITGTTYIHTGLNPNTDYRYKVVSNDDILGDRSEDSNVVSCKTLELSNIVDPISLFITNNSSYPLKSIQINNGNNILTSIMYRYRSFQILLEPGIYSIRVINNNGNL